ncbi:hypothetical protein E3N88_33849 [Mikania micrantha]|uniref:Uncharacterized protein n=1 Tax=Mikania micrantha TaxID=192012 RepID=A0A5N6MF02_9ASTR|nr:hypothetical protein E3N88_33849 [Mikania micrantha]
MMPPRCQMVVEICRMATEMYDDKLPSVCNGEGGEAVGRRLDRVPAGAVVREGRKHRESDVQGQGSIHISGVSGRSKDLFR